MNWAATRNRGDTPRAFEWIAFVLALVIQQNAFVSLPILMSNVPLAEMRDFDNPLNRVAIIFSSLCIGSIGVIRRREIAAIARANRLAVLYLGIVVISALWSIHPGISVRRSVGYILSILVAALLPVRFGVHRCMEVLSLSFAVSAIGSLVFVLIAPGYGIMQEGDLAGCWQGVFCTKELLGSVMAVAIFAESYLLIQRRGRRSMSYALIVLYCALLILSQSRTALLTAAIYVAGACTFCLWRRDRRIGVFGAVTVAIVLLTVSAIASTQPDLVFGVLGKDSTLTGRTVFWPNVLELVEKKPLLGWGYRAMWQSGDPTTTYIDSIAGFNVPSSHNAFLEIALQLGSIGVGLIMLLLIVAVRRGWQCLKSGYLSLGWFSIVFVIGIVMAGGTTETLGQNQVIEWVVFNTLFVSCGTVLLQGPGSMAFASRVRRSDASTPGGLVWRTVDTIAVNTSSHS